jgi:hypothetical protein
MQQHTHLRTASTRITSTACPFTLDTLLHHQQGLYAAMDDLDQWISHLSECKQLSEPDVKRLCDKVGKLRC